MKKKRRISLSLTILVPVMLGVLLTQGIALWAVYHNARDADYNDTVQVDKVQLLRAQMSMPIGLGTACQKIKDVYEANPIAEFPTDQAEIDNYRALYDTAIKSEEFINFTNDIPSGLLGDYAAYIRIGFFDIEKTRFVTVTCIASGSMRNPSFSGSFDTLDPNPLTGGAFYGKEWYDAKRDRTYLISGVSTDLKNPFGGWWIIRNTGLDTVYDVSDDFMHRYIWVAVASVSAMAVLSFIGIQLGLLFPIRRLSKRSDAYVAALQEGEMKTSFALDRKPFADEISTLNDSLFYMQEAMKGYSEQIKEATVREQKTAADLALAEKIQSSMVPSKPLLAEKVTFFGKMNPAKEVGGDFFNYFEIDKDHYGFYIGDVSGKGVSAALFMARAASVARLLIGELDIDRVNDVLCKDNNEDLFVTGFFGVIDTKSNTLHYVNCGHEPVYYRHKGTYAALDEEHNLPLGCLEGLAYKKQSIPLQEGDALFLYTDGLSEAMDKDGALFGKERILNTLNKNALLPGLALFHAMDEEVKGFVKDAEQSDDTCYVGMEFNQEKTISYETSKEGLAKVVDFAEENLSTYYDLKVISPLLVMLDELCSNVVRYSKATEASITLSYGPSTIRVTLMDNGFPFDPITAKVQKDEDEEGGLGIILVKSMSEAISYVRAKEKNILVLQAKTK